MKCAIYTRVSTDSQAEIEFNSCEAQEEKIKSFIKSQENMAIFKVYSDPGYTGANLDRPGLAELLEDIQLDKINLVISYKIDRLTRSPKDFYNLIETFDKYGVDFISVTERFDTSTPSGRLLRNIMLTFAQFERELTSERTRDKMMQRVQKGMWNGGTIPFGYRSVNKQLTINDDESKIIRSIYESYLTNYPITKIAKKTKLSQTRIYTILRNPLYIGKVKYAGKVWQGNHKPIISENIFDQAQQLHQKAKRTMRPYKNYAFAGLIKCKECGSHMSPCHTNKKKDGRRKRYYYYRCTSTFKKDWNYCQTRQVNANRLERYIVENLERISLDKQYIENLIFSLSHRGDGGRIGIPQQLHDSSKNTGKNDLSGDRARLELLGDTPKISGEIFSQTLSRLAAGLSSFRGFEKNLLAKKFFESIIYSKESIELSVSLSSGQKKENRPLGAANSVCKEYMAPRRGLEPRTYWLRSDSHYCESRTIPLP